MKIACLHTAEVHVATFDALFLAYPDAQVRHVVRADLLENARSNGLDAVASQTAKAMADLSDSDVVLCTCSTLGPLIGAAPHHLRIDRPAMAAALGNGPDILVAICLDSTRTATLGLLDDIAAQAGNAITPRLVLCDAAWPYFEAGDQQAFAASIADTIASNIASSGPPDCILLAQASMRAAAPLLKGDIPVLTTPELAVRAAIRIAQG